MAIDVITAVVKLAPATVNPSERLVLLVLAWHANKHGLNAWPAVSTIARETSLTRRAVQKVLRRLLSKGLVFVDSTRARRSVVYAVAMDVLDRERYSQSEASDHEPRSQSDHDDEFSTAINSEPYSPMGEPRSPHSEPRSPICEPRSPDPSLTVIEPSVKKYPAVPAVISSERKTVKPEDLAVTKRLAFETVEKLGATASYGDRLEDLKTTLARLGIPYDCNTVNVAMLTATTAKARRTA